MAFLNCEVFSKTLNMATALRVILPDEGELGAANTVYLLHGLSDNSSGWTRYTAVEQYTDPAAIKANLIAQLTAPVRWTYIVRNMLSDGVTEFTELGPGSVLQGLIRKVDPNAVVESKSTL